MVACAAENNVPVGVFRTWVERHVTEKGAVIFVPKQCNHCENAPCVKPCPTGATFKTRGGLVLVEDSLCIGCGACIQACPYGPASSTPPKGLWTSARRFSGVSPNAIQMADPSLGDWPLLSAIGASQTYYFNPVRIVKTGRKHLFKTPNIVW